MKICIFDTQKLTFDASFGKNLLIISTLVIGIDSEFSREHFKPYFISMACLGL